MILPAGLSVSDKVTSSLTEPVAWFEWHGMDLSLATVNRAAPGGDERSCAQPALRRSRLALAILCVFGRATCAGFVSWDDQIHVLA